MDCVLGRLPATIARPATPKFARPLVLFPELFTTLSHLSLLAGYLVSLGWEVCAIDLHAALRTAPPGLAGLLELAGEAITAMDREVVALGHGLGGLVALSLSARPAVAAGVALAPALPGFRSPLCMSLRNRLAARLAGVLRPPAGRTLFELIADADQFQRDTIIRTLKPASPGVGREVARGALTAPPAGVKPRLIVCGDADIFAPLDQIRGLATATGAELVTLPGRGHWLIGGRSLERAVHASQRFLVKALGRDLLLLYPENPPDQEPDAQD
ncbi:MAG TPA: alpha/beta fold hydrolase [Candidatus Binataceae bacterium]|nr:alpha/beta fold hydrolase [Candidatus Binataceae bacterium]